MIPNDVTRDDIIEAMALFDDEQRGQGRYDGWKSDGRFKYAIEYGGKLYPPKQIISLAAGIERQMFSGGEEANSFLDKLGFTVSPLRESSSQPLRTSLQFILDNYVEARRSESFGSDHSLWERFSEVEEILSQTESVKNREYLRVKWSMGKGNWAYLPWIALFDERETSTIQKGVYCVFLFRQDMSGVDLTLNQGVTHLLDEHGTPQGRKLLLRRAADLRRYCDNLSSEGFQLDNDIDLHSNQATAIDYEHSTVAYKLYEKDQLPSDAEILSDLEDVLTAYDIYLSDHFEGELENREATTREDLEAITADVSEKLRSNHLVFGTNHQEVVRNFVVSMATKRFVILTGLSGSGKTQIAKQFGRWLGEDRYKIVPVRPDWTGSEALFGYPDALQPADDGRRAWHVPDPLKFMLEAARNSNQPHLMILDEMNLAHVERYFADVVSGMESDEPCLPNLVKDDDGLWRRKPDAPKRIRLPQNLFIAGTVNVDETTYMFSPKILDRANTIEFRVEAEDLRVDLRKPGNCPPGNSELVRGFMTIAQDEEWHLQHPTDRQKELVEYLRELHRTLEGGFAFGHRVVYEAIRFAALHHAAGGGSLLDALDIQIMQKILPRLHGSRRRLEPVLEAVGKFCYDLTGSSTGTFDPVEHDVQDAELQRSFAKVQEMLERLRVNQFVSFTE
jgi:5-methylcytosine-specific restriction protein B